MADIPPPPPPTVDQEGRFARWTYQFWDYVVKNRPGFANSQITATSPILLSTSGTSSFALSHATSAVAAGTYGGGLVIPQIVINAFGHVISATNGGTAGTGGGGTGGGISAVVGAVSGTSTTGTLTAAYTGTLVAVGAVIGTSTTGTLTTAQTLVLAGLASGTSTTGTLTLARTLTAAGWVTGTTTTGTLTAAYAGTWVGAGDVLGTSTTGTFTGVFSTTGVSSGVYGGTAGIPRFDISAAGRVLVATNIIISATSPILHGTPGAGTLSWSHATSGVGTGLPGQTVITFEGLDAFGHTTSVGTLADFSIAGTSTSVGALITGTSTAAMFSWGTATGGFLSVGTGTAALWKGTDAALTGTATMAGALITGTATAVMFRASLGSSATSGVSALTGTAVGLNAGCAAGTGSKGLGTFAIPGSTIVAGRGLAWTAWGTHGGTNGLTQNGVTLGTALLGLGTNANAAAGYWRLQGEVLNLGADQQTFSTIYSRWDSAASGVYSSVTGGTLGLTQASGVNLTLYKAGTGTVASNNTLLGFIYSGL